MPVRGRAFTLRFICVFRINPMQEHEYPGPGRLEKPRAALENAIGNEPVQRPRESESEARERERGAGA
jgi:hypothetical protein